MNKMDKSLIFLLLFVSCNNSNEVSISDANKDTSIHIKTNSRYPTNLQLIVNGQTNDTFMINNKLVPGGLVDTTLHYEWYDKDFTIKYNSYKASKGKLRVKFKLYL